MKKYISLIFGLFSLTVVSNSIDDNLLEQYLGQFSAEHQETVATGRMAEYKKNLIDFGTDYLGNTASEMHVSNHGHRKYLMSLFSPKFSQSTMSVNKDWHKHLEVFSVKGAPHLYAKLFESKMVLEEVFGAYLLLTGYTNDLNTILERQSALVQIATDTALSRFLNLQVSRLQVVEEELLDLFHPERLMESGDAKVLEFQESLEPILDGWPILSSPLSALLSIGEKYYTLFPFIALGITKLVSLSRKIDPTVAERAPGRCSGGCCSCVGGTFKAFFMAAILYSQTSMQMDVHFQQSALDLKLTKALNALRIYLEVVESIRTEKTLPELLQFNLSEEVVQRIRALKSTLETLSEVGGGNFFQLNLFRAQVALNMFVDLKTELEHTMFHMAKILFYTSVANKLAEESSALVPVKFKSELTPTVNFQDLWNPALDEENAVPNDVVWHQGQFEHAILTGDNASGKSTLMRAVSTNLLNLAQVFGLVTASVAESSLFFSFHVYMRVNDVPEGSSASEIEENRMLQLNKAYKSYEPGQFGFYVADELFRSLGSSDALACSKLVLTALSSVPQVDGITSSHINSLCELDDSERPFQNIHMEVIKNSEQTIKTFKLHKGCNLVSSAKAEVDRSFVEFEE